MKYFTVLYGMPVAGLEDWMSKPESERKDMETEMKGEWDAWLKSHDAVQNSIGLGKNKRVTADSVEDMKNGFMLSSYVAGESADAVAEMFKDHPHLKIPGATIDIMEALPMGGK